MASFELRQNLVSQPFCGRDVRGRGPSRSHQQGESQDEERMESSYVKHSKTACHGSELRSPPGCVKPSISALAVTGKGTVLAFCEARTSSAGDQVAVLVRGGFSQPL